MEITIMRFEVEVKAVTRPDNIIAFVTWTFHTNMGEICIRGGTLKRKYFEKYKKEIISYDLPAYRAKLKYYKSVYINNKDLYRDLCMYTLKQYCQQTGESLDYDVEEVNPDDVPF